MTGELTLTGRVLPIGGLKEKLLAAIRNGLEKVLLPADNRSEWDELDKDITGAINVEFVENAVDAFAILFDKGINLKKTSRGGAKGAKVRKEKGDFMKKPVIMVLFYFIVFGVNAQNESDWQINENEKIDISDIDIFQNIYKLPYPYKDLDGFNYDERFPLINKKGLCVVESENITIMYQAWGGDYFVSVFEIKKRNDIYSLGKYIGVKSDIIINIFGGKLKEYENKQYISYTKKNDNRITFSLKMILLKV